MARLLSAAGLVTAAAADVLSGLLLVQLKAEAGARLGSGRDGPAHSQGAQLDVSEVLPLKAFTVMKSKIDTLEQQLTEEQNEDMAKILQQKADYEKRLVEQQESNRELDRVNAEIAFNTTKMKESNTVLRRRAHALQKANRILTSELKALQSNLTLAQEFVQQELAAAQEQAPEVQVLAELETLDAQTNKALEKQARLNEIGGTRMGVSLLEISVHEDKLAHAQGRAKDSLEGIVQAFVTQLERRAAEQNEGEAKLQKAFEEKFHAETQRRAELLEEQARLNATSAEVMLLHLRLSNAVQHLSGRHEKLTVRIEGIRKFAKRLGTSDLRLQTAEEPPAATNPSGHDGGFMQLPNGFVAKENTVAAVDHAAKRYRSARANATAAVGGTQGNHNAAEVSAGGKIDDNKSNGAARLFHHGRKQRGAAKDKNAVAAAAPTTAAVAYTPLTDDAAEAEDAAAERGHGPVGKLTSLLPKWLR